MTMQPERVTTQRAKYRAYVQRMTARQNKVERPVPQWDWAALGQKGLVEAWTRSEAKARIKDVLGVKKLKEVFLAARTK